MADESFQTTTDGTIVTSTDGKKRNYGPGRVPGELVPGVDPTTKDDQRKAEAYQKTGNIVDKSSGRADAKELFGTPNTTPKFKNYDQRVRLEVPLGYLVGVAKGPRLEKSNMGVLEMNSGIVFPYSPTIEVGYSADYSELNTLHSNYTQYFYKNSKVSNISVKGKFTCQNEFEARILLAVLHLGRALVKMKFGGEPDSGAPPPVCRLMGYGNYMFDKVPVVVKSFNMSVPNDVDYITVNQDEINDFGNTSVPTVTEISIDLLPVYSKNEMIRATVAGWLDGRQRLDGYL